MAGTELWVYFELGSIMKGAAEQIESIEQIRQAIAAANAAFGEAIRRGDAAAVAGLYAEDARLMPPNSEMVQGRDGIRAFWWGGIQLGIKNAVLTTVDVLGMNDLVCEIGRYDLSIEPEGGEPVGDSGKYVVVWKRTAEGAWKMQVDIWNTSPPAG